MNEHVAGPDAEAPAPAVPSPAAAERAPKRAPAKRAPAKKKAAVETVVAEEIVAVVTVLETVEVAPVAAAVPVPVPVPVTILVPGKPVRPKDPARQAIRRHLATHGAALLEQEARVRGDLPDSVHKMRVAARRLRSGLRTFRPLVDAEWARALGEELRWLATSLGAMRDREVLLARLERDIAALPEWAAKEPTLAAVRTELGKAMDTARDEALAALDSPRYAALITALAAAAADPPTTAAAQGSCTNALLPLMDKAFTKLADEAKHLHLDPPQVAITAESDDAWHEARITAKKARYAAEACEPVFGKPATQLVAQLTRVTENLGEHQDAAVAAEAVIEIASAPGVGQAAALTLGVLHGVQREAVRAARADFVAAWPQVAHKRWRTWL